MSYLPPSRGSNIGHLRTLRWCVPVILLLAFPLHTFAQGGGRSSVGTGGNHIVQGYIFFPSGRRAEGPIQVKLQSYLAGEISLIADSGGSFVFTSLAPGTYTVVVDAGQNYEIARESILIDDDVNLSRSGIPAPNVSRRYSLMIHLREKMDARSKPAVLDAALAAVPENARTLYMKSLELSRGGDTLKAIDDLKQAVALYPKFPLALNELGVQYLKLGKPEKAVEVLNNAIKVEPEAFTPRLNLGVALLEARQFNEAQSQLNEALKRNATAPTPHMYLGLTLAHLGDYAQAEKELLRSIDVGGDKIGLPHYYLGGLYWKQRDYARAVEQLEKYLQLSPNAPDAERVRGTIKELRTRL